MYKFTLPHLLYFLCATHDLLFLGYLELPKSQNFTEIPIRSSEIPFRWKDITLF